MIGIVDTGRGNMLSVCNAFAYLGAQARICQHPEDLEDVDRVVLPGVGAFADGMAALVRRDIPQALERVRTAGRPILGVCLGMQLLTRRSEEGPGSAGLGWIDADVVRLQPGGLRVPHLGWNETAPAADSPLLRGLPSGAEMYYAHSYQVVCDDPSQVVAVCDYGGRVTAAVQRDNVAGMQFHPEKSQDHGLKVLENFLSWDG